MKSQIALKLGAFDPGCKDLYPQPLFLSLEAALLLVSIKNSNLWPDPISLAYTECSFRILNQSDLSDLMRSL